MINGVIFDMDGLMFDTERMWATFWEPALAALGLEYKEGLAEAERGTAGETSRNIVRQFYGEDCDANAIIDSLHRVADEEFRKPVPKKPGLDELLAWLDANHIPMAVASSSRVHVIEGNLNNWGLTHYFKALVSGQQVKHSKPDPEIFLLAAEKLGTDPARTLVLEDSYNGVRAGAAGGFVTVMVPDLLPADDERGAGQAENGRTVIKGKNRKIVPCSGVLLSPVLCYNKRKEKRRHSHENRNSL